MLQPEGTIVSTRNRGAEIERVEGLLESVADKPEQDQIKHLLNSGGSDLLNLMTRPSSPRSTKTSPYQGSRYVPT